MAQPFIFGGNTNMSYQDVQRKRALAEQLLLANANTPRNVGEGLTAIGRALAARGIEKRVGRADEANRTASKATTDALLSGILGGSAGGGAGGDVTPVSYNPPDPASPKGIAADTMAALGTGTYTPGDKESFVKAMMPHAIRVSQETGVDPRLVIAQAAQETGWGKSAPGNNFFGIKSHGKSGGNNLDTTEFVDGQPIIVNDSFRGYSNMGESALDYARFLRENPRYKDMLSAGDLEGQISALGKSGYATDPNYSTSVGNIARSIEVPGLPAAQPAQGGAGPQANPNLIMQIVQQISSPYTPPEQRALLQMGLDRLTAQADPMRAIEMEKARLELDALKNPGNKDRKTEKDRNGDLRYIDNGELVFKDVGGTPPPNFDDEAKLRQEFNQLPVVKDFSQVNDAWGRIKASAKNPSASGDMALIFNFMKLLDPGSTVREGEFATASNATGVEGRVINLYNSLLSGERLSENQRRDFVDRAGVLFNSQAENYNSRVKQYRDLGTQYNVSPDRIAKVAELYDVSGEQAARAIAQDTVEQLAKTPKTQNPPPPPETGMSVEDALAIARRRAIQDPTQELNGP